MRNSSYFGSSRSSIFYHDFQSASEKRAYRSIACNKKSFLIQISPNHFLQKLVTVDMPYQASGVVVGGDVGRVLREDIAYYLVYRIIALFKKSLIYHAEVGSYFILLVLFDGKRHCLITHVGHLLK